MQYKNTTFFALLQQFTIYFAVFFYHILLKGNRGTIRQRRKGREQYRDIFLPGMQFGRRNPFRSADHTPVFPFAGFLICPLNHTIGIPNMT